ncbi:MAG: type I pullulanase [Spirochaetales bacterium]
MKNRVVAGRLALLLWLVTLSFVTPGLAAQVERVELPGTLQVALGGAAWNTNVETTRMESVGDGVWEFVAKLPKGSFEYKVAINGSWDVNYGKNGADHGDNIPLKVLVADTIVKFVFREDSHTVFDSLNNPDKVKAPDVVPPKKAPVAAKPLPGNAFLDAADRIRVKLDAAVEASAVLSQVQLSLDGKPLPVASVTAVQAGGAGLDPDKITLPGTLQSALGGVEWNPNGDSTRMWETSPGVFEFVAAFPAGSYEYKVAQGGTWEKNWGKDAAPGGDNLTLQVPAPAPGNDNTLVRFVFDKAKGLLRDSINNPEVLAPASLPPTPTFAPPKAGPSATLDLTLSRSLGLDDLALPLKLLVGEKEFTVYARDVLSAATYYHAATDLGARYSAESTTFAVWSPVSDRVRVELSFTPAGEVSKSLDLKRDATGTWSATVPGDLDGRYYQYRFHSYGKDRVAADVNGYGASLDGKRSQVVNLAATNPEGWASTRIPPLAKTTDAILYEVHVRDFTIDESSGVDSALRGTYLGLVQRGTSVPGKKNAPTGLDYLVKLGVTDLHVLPFQKFNPGNTAKYNWGYETTLFNVPDARYATNPKDSVQTIGEVKTMVKGLHAAGLRLVMDVVYNHALPVSGDASPFDASVPFYYFRTDDAGKVLNESGVGNSMNDQRPMVRKFIRDSLLYWVNEYKVDGFRFDLVGMFTKETVSDLADAVRAVRPDAVMYGEPWTGGGPTRFGKGEQKGMNFAVFNDNYRNVLRGDLDGTRKGYVTGNATSPVEVQRGLAGSFDFGGNIKDFATSPRETINYISAHDNSTLMDKFDKLYTAKDPLRLQSARLAAAMLLGAQGIPFLEGGAELGRTKGGNANSYNSGDAVNRFDWLRAQDYKTVSDYYAGWIALRRAHPAFRLDDPAQIRSALKFIPPTSAASPIVSYTVDGTQIGDSWKTVLFVSNGKAAAGTYKLPAGNWTLVANGTNAGTAKLGTATGTLKLDPLSAYVLYQ